MSERNPQILDLDKVIESNAGDKARRIPKFLIRWFKKFIHLDFINNFLKEGYVGVEFCENAIKYNRQGGYVSITAATEEEYTVIVSQKLLQFLACDEVESKEIYENCAYLPELMTRLKTFQKMKESLLALQNRKAVSVQELAAYDRQLVCIQKHGKVAERQNHNYYFSNTKKLQDKENHK